MDEDDPLPLPDPDPQPARDGLPMPRRIVAIAALSFGTALAVIDGAVASVALPTIARDLKVPSEAAVLVVTVYQLTMVMTLLPLSALGDRIGYRRLYQYGQVVFTVATALCFFAHSLPVLLSIRVLQAVGAGAVLSVSSAMVRIIYPSRQLGRGLGVNSVVVSSSAALAPTLGGLILAVAPWPWVFAAAAPFGILSLLLGRSLPDPQPRDGRFDVAGALLCAATFGLVISGFEAAVHGGGRLASAALLVAGAATGIVFVRRELHEERPILPVDLLGRPIFALSTLAALTAFIGTMTLLLSMPFRLQHGYGYTPGETGAVLAASPLTMMVMAPLAGALSDRFPAAILGGIGTSIAVGALLLLAWLPDHPSHLDVVWRMSLFGLGWGLFFSPNARLQLGAAPRDRAASVGGMIATTRLTGQTLGATVVAALLAFGLGDGPLPALTAAALAVTAGLCSVARLSPKVRAPKPA